MDGRDFLGTKVLNAETGEDLSGNVRSVTIVHRAGELPVATIDWVEPIVDATVDVEASPA